MRWFKVNKISCCCTWEIIDKRKQVVIPPELVKLIWQGCPLTLGDIPLKWALTEMRDCF